MLGKDLLGLYDASAEDITDILDTAVGMKKLLTQNLKKLPHLQGRTVTTLFYENSTRTRCSFELAAKYLGAGTVNISASSSSLKYLNTCPCPADSKFCLKSSSSIAS